MPVASFNPVSNRTLMCQYILALKITFELGTWLSLKSTYCISMRTWPQIPSTQVKMWHDCMCVCNLATESGHNEWVNPQRSLASQFSQLASPGFSERAHLKRYDESSWGRHLTVASVSIHMYTCMPLHALCLFYVVCPSSLIVIWRLIYLWINA